MPSNFNARSAEVYERSMGRWSRRLAPSFVAFAGTGARVLDVGCGTGSLIAELAGHDEVRSITGIDFSDIYIDAARAGMTDRRVTLHQGDACAMPFARGQFDCALCQLVLQFVPDPAAAAVEMVRVVRPGGTVAAAVWNSGGGMPHQRMFWDTAAMLDPKAGALRGKTFSRPMTRRGDLAGLFQAAGLAGVEESSATIWMDFADFADFWDPVAGGEGTLGAYVAGLPEPASRLLEGRLRDAYESGQPDGPRHFACTAFLCKGTVP